MVISLSKLGRDDIAAEPVRKCGRALERQCTWSLPRDMCAALRWMTFCLLLCWMPHCLHFRSEIKIKHLSVSTISEMIEIIFMNYMIQCLTRILDEAPGVMATAVLKESVQEMYYARHFVFCHCLDCILHPGLNFIPLLAPLITY